MERLDAIVDAIDDEMEAQKMGLKLTAEERLEAFGDFDPDEQPPRPHAAAVANADR